MNIVEACAQTGIPTRSTSPNDPSTRIGNPLSCNLGNSTWGNPSTGLFARRSAPEVSMPLLTWSPFREPP